MANKNSIPQIKNEKQYDALKENGYSKQKAARIANTPDAGTKGSKSSTYEERSKKELFEKAKQVGIRGRSKMNKKELITALRNN